MKTIKIQLIQGENTPLEFIENVDSRRLDEVSGTLAYRILKLRENAIKFRQNIGFSFARKFDVKIIIDGQSIDGTKLFNSTVKFGITVQSNDLSYKRFHAFIDQLVIDILSGQLESEGTYNELKSGLVHGVSVSKGAKQYLKQVAELS